MGRPWGSFEGLWRSGISGGECGGPRKIKGVPGRFWTGPGGLLENVFFFLWGDGFVNILMKY